MNVRRTILNIASTTLLSGGVFLSSPALGQDLFPADNDSVDPVHLFGVADQPAAAVGNVQAVAPPVSRSNVRTSQMSVSELRQARALYRAQQRTARLEYNLWMGYEPLRPNWNSVPMMSSRYTNRRIYVPAYVYAR